MEEVRHFLELSTIHGLYYVSSARKYARLFWVLIVIGGFTGAGYLIHESFDNWNQSPISTTIETLPISEITFPNITVCPPKNSFLDLNYDIMKAETVHLNNLTREKMLDTIMELIAEGTYRDLMNNLSKLEDPDRFYNWYHGFTKITFPLDDEDDRFESKNFYSIETTAKSGNISTQYFGEKFNARKVERSIRLTIRILLPESMRHEREKTLYVAIERNTIEQLRDQDEMWTDSGKPSNNK